MRQGSRLHAVVSGVVATPVPTSVAGAAAAPLSAAPGSGAPAGSTDSGTRYESTYVAETETFSNGPAAPSSEQFTIADNASGTYDVGSYRVHVAISGNTKVREIWIVE
jgi:hypothetical protein